VSGRTGASAENVTATGAAADQPHENMPPYIVLGYAFIYVGD
jgi:microcystin-dependent protein